MPKKNLTSLELTAIINELQFLIHGKISQIYHQEKTELLFQLHARGEGKQLLKIVPGKFLCLTAKKDTVVKPSSFCMQLRKHLGNASINKIYQKGSERIIVFELEKSEKFNLIIELFSRGNLVLTNSDNKIIAALEQKNWKDRKVRVKEQYIFPEPKMDWKKISEKDLTELLKKTDRNILVTTLATRVGLGGVYAEELCDLINIDKNQSPNNVSNKDIKLILKQIKDFLKKIENSSGFIYENQITPFALKDQQEIKKTKTYNEAIDTLNPFEIISPFEQKIKTMQKMICHQEESIISQENKIDLNTKKGETVYENYQPLQKILDFVNSARKEGKEWAEIEVELKKVKKIKSIDLRSKKIVIDL